MSQYPLVTSRMFLDSLQSSFVSLSINVFFLSIVNEVTIISADPLSADSNVQTKIEIGIHEKVYYRYTFIVDTGRHG